MNLRLQYARPQNLEQTIGLLDGLGSGAMIISGGQEIMPFINYGRLTPSVLVDIGALKELQGIETAEDGISIGALTVHRDVQSNPIVVESLPLLAHAAKQIGGGWQVHNRGTIAGNVVAMHPLYDIIPVLLALDANIEIADAAGSRTESLANLITSTSHKLGTNAVLVRVVIPKPASGQGWGYEKLKIAEGSYGSANAAAVVSVSKDGNLSDLHLVLGAVTEQPIDLSAALNESGINQPGSELDEAITAACAAAIKNPLSDQRGHGEYRQAMAAVVARRAVATAIVNASA
jgi:carbon-monoxide dehydrogenase medium subunit